MSDSLAPPSDRLVRALMILACVVVGLHVLGWFYLGVEGRYFATEDDGYRAYYGYLTAEGSGTLIGRFWLPGQFFALGGLGRLGLDAAAAPLVLGGIATVILLTSVYSLALDLAPPGWGRAAAWGSVAVSAASPLVLVLHHSALSEPLANAMVVFAASALVRRHMRGPNRLVASGGLAMLLATWVRYEAWAYAGVYAAAATLWAWKKEGRRASLREGLMASIGLVGPAGWLLAQYVMHDDPFAFLETIDTMSRELAGPASRTSVLALRAEALGLWATGAVTFSVTALVLLRKRAKALRALGVVGALGLPVLLLQIASGKGLGVFLLDGRLFEFFVPRLVSNVEAMLFPLAGLGLALLANRPSPLARATLVGLGMVVIGMFIDGAQRPMTFVDPSSVQAGLMLRRGELDEVVGDGALLVERVSPRPPMGWASLGVLWSQWDRTVWLEERGEDWLLVEPTDVEGGRRQLPVERVRAHLDARGIDAAWILTDNGRRLMEQVWPGVLTRRVGDGRFMLRPTGPEPGD